MNFTVQWEDPIRHELHELWAIAPNPVAVREARDGIEQSLVDDPIGAGRHLSEGLWRLVVPPLVVHFEIDSDARLIKITDVQLIG